MVASETYAEFLREQLAPLGRVTLRRMFGKSGVFCDALAAAHRVAAKRPAPKQPKTPKKRKRPS